MRYRRHPAEVTSDRLGDAVGRWHEHFTGEERDMISKIRVRLEEIAEDAGSQTANTGRAPR
jgi:hypothetical protein